MVTRSLVRKGKWHDETKYLITSYNQAPSLYPPSYLRSLLLFLFLLQTMAVGKIASMLGLLLTHPNEFRTLLQFYLFHEQKRDITAQQEHPTSGWDRQSMRRCWDFLDLTSRSFAAVIKELDGDLARTVRVLTLFPNTRRRSHWYDSSLFCTL